MRIVENTRHLFRVRTLPKIPQVSNRPIIDRRIRHGNLLQRKQAHLHSKNRLRTFLVRLINEKLKRNRCRLGEGVYTYSRLRDIPHFKFDVCLFQRFTGESRIDRVVKSNQVDLSMTVLDFARTQLFCDWRGSDPWDWRTNDRLSRFQPPAPKLTLQNIGREISQIIRLRRQLQKFIIGHGTVALNQPLPRLLRIKLIFHRQRISPPHGSEVPNPPLTPATP